MTLGAGLAAQIGIANESTPGTAVAVTTFTEFMSETLERRPNFAQGGGIRAGGLVQRASRRVEVSHDAGGQVTFNVPSKGLGKWLQAMFGSYATTATQIAATPAYQQIHNLGSADGNTFTIQKGVPETNGAVDPLTYPGAKLLDWTLSCGPNANAQLQVTVDALDELPVSSGARALQTASYSATTSEFGFHQLTVQSFSAYAVTSGIWTPTSPTALGVVRNFSMKGGQPKDNTRWQAGSNSKAEQLVNDYQPITGQIDVDYASTALYNQFAGNTSSGLVVALTGATISGANKYLLQFVLPAAFLESGSSPKVAGNGVVTVSYPFTALDDGVNGALQCLHVSTDTTV